jgi:hypothetical protein
MDSRGGNSSLLMISPGFFGTLANSVVSDFLREDNHRNALWGVSRAADR